jgi:hypothetical protein
MRAAGQRGREQPARRPGARARGLGADGVFELDDYADRAARDAAMADWLAPRARA